MKINGNYYRSLWREDSNCRLAVINQTLLPHRFEITHLNSVGDVIRAINSMIVRGAPLIGVTAAYGLVMAVRDNPANNAMIAACTDLVSTRPTAVNLRNCIDRLQKLLTATEPAQRFEVALKAADAMAEEDVKIGLAIAKQGFALISAAWKSKNRQSPVNILTHCNAGWLATVDWGTALAPIYLAHDSEIPVHVWVSETRPRNQGSFLTALELGWHGIPHTIVVDNAGGHLMQHGKVDLCIVGADRVTSIGDTANKIGTYLKALAAQDNSVPFYVALPSTTIDWLMADALSQIDIEERSASEILSVAGLTESGELSTIKLAPPGSTARNPAFDVTPARLISGFITEFGIFRPEELKNGVQSHVMVK